MLRWLTGTVALATIVAAFGVTWLKHDTRRLEARLQAQERQIEKAESDIAILRAELGYLTRPERLDPLARSLLGLQPTTSAQIVTLDQIPLRPGQAAVLPAPAATSAPSAATRPVRSKAAP